MWESRHGSPWTPDTARAEALRLLSRIVGGENPSADGQARRGATTVADLCDAYLDDAASGRMLPSGACPASLAADLGLADATIAAMLGHKGHTITRRHIHSADAALLAAADAVATKATALMAAGDAETGSNRRSSDTDAARPPAGP